MMLSEDIEEDIGVAVREIMKIEHVSDYKYQIEGQSECGDNYMGVVIFVKVQPDNDENKPYALVVKTAKRSEELRKNFPVELFYNRELFMYSEVFPTFRKFISEMNYNFELDFLPKLYWIDKTDKKETIALENLKARGFKLHDRKKPWNLQHSLLTMKHYGKFHACSMALKEQKPELFNRLGKNMGPVIQAFFEKVNLKKYFHESFEHIQNLLRNIGRDDLAVKYKVWLNEIEDLFKSNPEEDKLAICHMDCWNNNFMFKYESYDETSPSEVSFLDFQLSLVDSPAKDLSYNIYTTCDNTCLKHFDELLQTYHESLTQSLVSLGCHPQHFFTMQDLRRHFRKYGIYGIFLSINLIKMQLLDKNDAPSLEKMVKDENMLEGFNVKVSNQEEYDRRILDVFLHFGDNFL